MCTGIVSNVKNGRNENIVSREADDTVSETSDTENSYHFKADRGDGMSSCVKRGNPRGNTDHEKKIQATKSSNDSTFPPYVVRGNALSVNRAEISSESMSVTLGSVHEFAGAGLSPAHVEHRLFHVRISFSFPLSFCLMLLEYICHRACVCLCMFCDCPPFQLCVNRQTGMFHLQQA